MTPALELRAVEAGYGPFRALFGVTLSVPPGGAVALLGANGAGRPRLPGWRAACWCRHRARSTWTAGT